MKQKKISVNALISDNKVKAFLKEEFQSSSQSKIFDCQHMKRDDAIYFNLRKIDKALSRFYKL